jgi:predicted nucleic acid-binding protein
MWLVPHVFVILVDTSAWIEYQRATGSAADRRLTAAITSGEQLATTGIVLLELLAGARDEAHARELERMLAASRFLSADDPLDQQSAAALYRACRAAGATVRRLPDCLIAAVAIRTRAELLHCDADFDALARHSPLACVSLS